MYLFPRFFRLLMLGWLVTDICKIMFMNYATIAYENRSTNKMKCKHCAD